MNHVENIIGVYVSSLYQVSCEENKEKLIFDQLSVIGDIFRRNIELIDILNIPSLNKREKRKMIDEIFQDKVDIFIVNFIKIMTDNRRISLLFKIIEKYKKIYYQNNNIKIITVISAVELSDDEKLNIQKKCEKIFKNKIIADYLVDEDIIAGVIIKSDDKIYDMSAVGKINDIKKSISEKIIG